MTTFQRIDLLASHLAAFPEMEGWNADALGELVKAELGAVDALENGHDSIYLLPPDVILHIISGNTPLAGIQSLVRGLILGSRNLCKIPGEGLPRFEEFVSGLAPELREKVEVARTLLPGWQEKADAVVVFGADATVDFFRERARRDQIFAGYGNRWSGAVVFEDAAFQSIPLLTRDIILYDQMGCLSPQIVWLHDSEDPREFGERLAASLAEATSLQPAGDLTPEDERSIAAWRLEAEWQVSQKEGIVWSSRSGPVWGVAWVSAEDEPRLSCLHRHVTLVPFSERPNFGKLADSISSLGIWPPEMIKKALPPFSKATRLCPVGSMQFPSPRWQQDGFPALGRLVRRVGVEG